MNIKIRTKIYPTEDENKVLEALHRIFPLVDFIVEEDLLLGESDSNDNLEMLKNIIDLQMIRDSSRKMIRKGKRDKGVVINLNKQAAYEGKINFSSDSPMGPITVKIHGDVNEICDYLAPSTL